MPLPLPTSDPGDSERRSSLPTPPPPLSGPPQRDASAGSTAVCYRHPDRPVGRRCTRCGRPACADCLQQASVGSNCAECVKASKPDMATRAKHWQAGQPAFVTYVLIALNVAAFVGLGLIYGLGDMFAGAGGEAHSRFALLGGALDGVGGLIPDGDGGAITTNGDDWYRLITSGFLHFGLIHLGFNMYILYVLGGQMEPMIGRIRFASIYFASLLGGAAGALLVEPRALTAGASGAVFGLLGAMTVGLWLNGVNPFSTGIGRLLLINLAFTFLWPNISVGGHLGGVIAGALCAVVTMAPGWKGYPRWTTYAAPAVVAAVSLAAAVVAVR